MNVWNLLLKDAVTHNNKNDLSIILDGRHRRS